jgi:hypothetical protein
VIIVVVPLWPQRRRRDFGSEEGRGTAPGQAPFCLQKWAGRGTGAGAGVLPPRRGRGTAPGQAPSAMGSGGEPTVGWHLPPSPRPRITCSRARACHSKGADTQSSEPHQICHSKGADTQSSGPHQICHSKGADTQSSEKHQIAAGLPPDASHAVAVRHSPARDGGGDHVGRVGARAHASRIASSPARARDGSQQIHLLEPCSPERQLDRAPPLAAAAGHVGANTQCL